MEEEETKSAEKGEEQGGGQSCDAWGAITTKHNLRGGGGRHVK